MMQDERSCDLAPNDLVDLGKEGMGYDVDFECFSVLEANDPQSQFRNVLLEKSFLFAKSIIFLHRQIVSEKRDYEISRQFVRSGTAIGSMVKEAQNAESKLDFIHKPGIAQKECDETYYWLELMVQTDIIQMEEFNELHSKLIELLKIIRSSIITSKKRIEDAKSQLKPKI